MRIYISASYAKQEDMRPIRDALAKAGHVVTSSWIGEETTVSEKWRGTSEESRRLRRRLGHKDMAEVFACDLFINDQTIPSVSGGLHCELGMALAMSHLRLYDMQIWTIGEPTPRSPFFEMADRHFLSWQGVMNALEVPYAQS